MAFRIGCQLNCWALGADFDQGLVTAVREAGEIGFEGVESNWRMINTWEDRAEELGQILEQAGVVISALFFGAGSAEATAAKQEIDDALRTAAFLQRFGADRMMVGGGKATDDADAFKAVCGHYDELGKRVLGEYGVKACYHLHHGAIASSPDEIRRMMDLTDASCWFLCPDSGIMAKGGHDVVEVVAQYAPRIAYVHFKDWGGGDAWTMLGQGVVDHAGMLEELAAQGYDGWVVSENESRRQDLTPKQQQAADREWLRGRTGGGG